MAKKTTKRSPSRTSKKSGSGLTSKQVAMFRALMSGELKDESTE